jgi:DNA-binding LacI/PurR family transcriptional regulator
MSSVTLKDIAQEAGVSISTVSLVLSGRILPQRRKSKKKKSSRLCVFAVNLCFEWHFIRQMLINLEAAITQDRYYPVIIPARLAEETHEILENVVLQRPAGYFPFIMATPHCFNNWKHRAFRSCSSIIATFEINSIRSAWMIFRGV